MKNALTLCLLFSACSPVAVVGQNQQALDPVSQPPADVSLLLLQPGADVERVVNAVQRGLHGRIYEQLGARLVTAGVTDNADAALAGLGVAQRFQRAVDPSEIPNATLEEQRFVRVFNARYYSAPVLKLLAKKSDQPFERAPTLAEKPAGFDTLTTPYASGTVVVALLLPESNGVAEPSTDDWTEDSILAAYQSVQEALEALERSEPNSGLRFIVHYESSPANGGLPGTIDCDFEYGLHAQFGVPPNGVDESTVSQTLWERLLGHAVNSDFDGAYEYLNGLRERYRADGAYAIHIASANDFANNFRAHAYINGPYTSLPNTVGFEVFMHESGHIFGALDEYCPDACVPPTALAGYLGAINANAAYFVGGTGFENGQGEDQSSLMKDNAPDAVQGYTRAAWGWSDSDGDGIVEVRDTLPQTKVSASSTSDGHITLAGSVLDVPATRWFGSERSVNHIAAVEWRPAGASDWFALPLDVAAQSRIGEPTAFSFDLGSFPAGAQNLEVRARNTVGNTDLTPRALSVAVSGSHGNNPPRAALFASATTVSDQSSFTLRAFGDDRDGDSLTFRFDTDGDGVYDTAFGSATTVTVSNLSAGLHKPGVQVRDRRNATATATVEILVLAKDVAPAIDIAGAQSEIFVPEGRPLLTALGDAVDYNWVAESATNDPFRLETGFAPGNVQFQPSLPTPLELLKTQVRLGRIGIFGAPTLGSGPNFALRSMMISPTVMVTAYGREGLYFTDLSNFGSPQPLTHLLLETDARDLFLVGKTLFVLGDSLAAVDVTDPTAPKEVLQQKTVTRTGGDTQAFNELLPDGEAKSGVAHTHAVVPGKLADITVSFTVDAPDASQLRLTLDYQDVFGTEREIVLRDQVAGPSGLQTYTFGSANGGPLAALIGLVAAGTVELHAMDAVADGQSGTLVSTTVQAKTATRAYAPIDGASLLAGSVQNRYVVVMGNGAEVVDSRMLDKLSRTSSLTGTGTYGAAVSGSTLIALSPLESKIPPPTPPQVKGLYAVDLTTPSKPRVVRQDVAVQGQSRLFIIGDRFYFTQASGGRGGGGDAVGNIASVSAFVAGGDYLLGALPTTVDVVLFGDASQVWTLSNGLITEFDVTDPKATSLITQYQRPQPTMFQSLGGLQVSLALGHDLYVATLGQVQHPISKTFRVTLQARNAAGRVATASRTIQVQPYDHPPSLDSLALTSGSVAGDTFSFQVTASDIDAVQVWDPTLAVRADLDGDGVWETTWQLITSGQPANLAFTPAQPGAYTARVQVRDSYGATADGTLDYTVR